jgi:hypothetical protein
MIEQFFPPLGSALDLQGLKPSVTYFATKSTGRAFDLYELRAASFWFVLENRTSPSCLLI